MLAIKNIQSHLCDIVARMSYCIAQP